MKADVRSEFEDVAYNTLDDAQAVACSLEDFHEGLELVMELIQERLEAVEDELRLEEEKKETEPKEELEVEDDSY